MRCHVDDNFDAPLATTQTDRRTATRCSVRRTDATGQLLLADICPPPRAPAPRSREKRHRRPPVMVGFRVTELVFRVTIGVIGVSVGLIEFGFCYVEPNTKYRPFRRHSFQPISWLSAEKVRVWITTPPGRRAEYCNERVCVCVCVCLSAIVSSELHVRFSRNFLRMLTMAVARSSVGGVVICYVFPVLWMTSYLHTRQGCSTSPPSRGAAHMPPT